MRCPNLAELPPPPAGKTGWPWTIETPLLPPLRADGSPWPRISIVTPSYNQGRFIEETLRSVLLQGYPDIEYIVIDGASTDESVAIIKKYAPWLAYWVSEQDRGQAHALNKGLGRATGGFLNWINSDDSLRPHALQIVAEAAALTDNVDLISGVRVLKDPQTGWEFAENMWIYGWLGYLAGHAEFPQDATFFSDFACRLATPLDERLNYGFDVAFFSRALPAARRVVLCRSVLSQMHVYPAQKTRTPDPAKVAEGAILRDEYGPKLGLLGRLMRTRFHAIVKHLLVPIIFRKERKRFLVMERNFRTNKWELLSP